MSGVAAAPIENPGISCGIICHSRADLNSAQGLPHPAVQYIWRSRLRRGALGKMAVELKDSVGSVPLLAVGKVLLVDDEPELRRVFRRSLARAGFQVVEAADGQMALELVRQGDFDVVISDLCMPKLGGLGLLDRLNVEAPLLPVVLISGSAGFADVSANEYGAFDYLPKPVSLVELRNRVANAIIEHRRRVAEEQEEQRVSETRLIAAAVPDFRKASA